MSGTGPCWAASSLPVLWPHFERVPGTAILEGLQHTVPVSFVQEERECSVVGLGKQGVTKFSQSFLHVGD